MHGDRVLASIDVADGPWARMVGLLGRGEVEVPLLLPRTRSIHTIGMRVPIDAAFCCDELVIRRIVTLAPWRMTRPRPGECCVIEAAAGAFGAWGVRVGDRLTLR